MSRMTAISHRQIIEQSIARQITDATPVALTLICTPLRLERSFIPESAADLSVLQPAFSALIAENGESPVPELYHPGWVSHGVLASTPAELASFYHRLFTGKVLSSESLSAMTTLTPVPAAPPQYRSPCYVLGITECLMKAYILYRSHSISIYLRQK